LLILRAPIDGRPANRYYFCDDLRRVQGRVKASPFALFVHVTVVEYIATIAPA
jgi:hypothetical protein